MDFLEAILEPLGEFLLEFVCYVAVKVGTALWQGIVGLFQ